ncbi:MAG TPA: hypothetical protein VMT24_03475 [Aggregatilineaceae bacterium]|nr:hypothetical protein [Aggregatilineaceae bacterium]
MTDPAEIPITLLYTAALGGDLALLPRLRTRIRAEQANLSGTMLLVDLGRACAPEVWICEATKGIGMLVAMDGMGYDAFHIGPKDALYAQPQDVLRLRATIATPLAAGPWVGAASRGGTGVVFSALDDFAAPSSIAAPPSLFVTLRQSDSPIVTAGWRNDRRFLVLDAGGDRLGPTLGRLDLIIADDPPGVYIVQQIDLDLPESLPPDPTMTSVIEFVESEARRFARRSLHPGPEGGTTE